MKSRLSGHGRPLGRVANPRDAKGHRCGLRLALTRNASISFVPPSVKQTTRSWGRCHDWRWNSVSTLKTLPLPATRTPFQPGVCSHGLFEPASNRDPSCLLAGSLGRVGSDSCRAAFGSVLMPTMAVAPASPLAWPRRTVQSTITPSRSGRCSHASTVVRATPSLRASAAVAVRASPSRTGRATATTGWHLPDRVAADLAGTPTPLDVDVVAHLGDAHCAPTA